MIGLSFASFVDDEFSVWGYPLGGGYYCFPLLPTLCPPERPPVPKKDLTLQYTRTYILPLFWLCQGLGEGGLYVTNWADSCSSFHLPLSASISIPHNSNTHITTTVVHILCVIYCKSILLITNILGKSISFESNGICKYLVKELMEI